MKLIVEAVKARNPLVAPSMRRKAGVHRSAIRSDRRVAELALRRELDRLVNPSP